MEKTVSQMKIGDRLIFGSYSAGINNNGVPIVWLKASKDCDFIACDVLDFLNFDSPQTDFRRGCADYATSNILSFLNSESPWWYVPKRFEDAPPMSYKDHFGFLYYFDDYELVSLVEKEGMLMRLPTAFEIEGGFSLFKRKGVRARASVDCVHHRFEGSRDHFANYWLRPEESVELDQYTAVPCLGISGKVEHHWPSRKMGLRPVCTINPLVSVKNVCGNEFTIIPFEVTEKWACTDDELMDFLGIAINL